MTAMGALERSSLGEAMRTSLWLYPSIEIVHLVGIALLFGSIAVLDLRLLGLSPGLPARELAAHVLPWTIGSFALIVPSGLAMFVAHATDFLSHPLFALKMGLILAAGANAGLHHAGLVPARLAAGLSLGFWVAVIACGRLLAYY